MKIPQGISAAHVKQVFQGAADLVVRPLRLGETEATAFFLDGLTSGIQISDFVLHPLTQLRPGTGAQLLEQCLCGAVYSAVAQRVPDMETLCSRLVNGFCVLVFAGVPEAVAFEVKTGEKRGPSAPEVESTVKGPRDAFTETGRTNTSLVRRHLRSPFLRIFETQVGTKSGTNVSLLWLEGTTDQELVRRMQYRLQELHPDSFLSPAAVEELITGSRKTAFPLLRYTERPDTFCRGLLEGQIGLLVDGLPLGYLTPVQLTQFLTSQEDLGVDFVSASGIRVLRYGALLVSLLLPALYLGMTAFHPEMIPVGLLRSIIENKQLVPFSGFLEILGLLLAFEILQEGGLHLPRSLGQSVSVIGGLVVGSAAVEARLISPSALIAAAVAGICGFAIPGRELADAIRIWRFVLTLWTAALGLFGLTLGIILLLLHLGSLESFGRSYLRPFDGGKTRGAILRRRVALGEKRP